MPEESFDILIAGAGAAGLMAAYELSKTSRSVAIVEARDRVGGRIHTIDDSNFSKPVEAGPEFIHGDMKLTLDLMKEANTGFSRVKGSLWQKNGSKFEEQKDFIEDYKYLESKCKALQKDISVSEFLKTHLQHSTYSDLAFSLKNYVEGYYAADTRKASVQALCRELSESSDVQYRVDGGYVQLVNYLEFECRKNGVQFFLSSPIKRISWKRHSVEFNAGKGKFYGKKLLVTLPISILRSGIGFSPALPEKKAAAKKLGYGPVVKTVFEFEEKFWADGKVSDKQDLSDLGFVFSIQKIPTWWTQYPENAAIITGWSGGPHAEELKNLSDDSIKELALKSLASVFNVGLKFLRQKLKAVSVFNWMNQPYTLGGYSYEVVNGKIFQQTLKEPVEDTIYFAGEGVHEGPEIGTVEGALMSGKSVVEVILK